MAPDIRLPAGLADNPRLDRWIRFGDRMVTIATGKVELGQGVLTALVQIAAEELDIAPDRVAIVSGDTTSGPNEGYTAGSQSIEQSGAATRLGAAPADLGVENGAFTHDGRPTNLDYWSLAAAIDWARPPEGRAAVKPAAEYKLVGTSLPRLDLAAKVSGAPFIHDIDEPGMLHGWVLRPPRRGAAFAGFARDRLGRFDWAGAAPS